MPNACAECGAPVESGTCRDNFDALLALEWQVPGGAGTLAHFYAVSSYVLQHPDSMSYREESLAWLRAAVAEAVAGTVTTEELRRRARERGTGHVTRRADDPVPAWPVQRWSINVTDILDGGVVGYADHVRNWAASVLADLDAAGA